MAHIRTHDTTERRKNKVVKTYGVVWREPDRDQFGLPIPVNPDHPRGRSDARLAGDLRSAARHTTGTSALAEQTNAGSCRLGMTRAAGSTRRR
jgi:integrase